MTKYEVYYSSRFKKDLKGFRDCHVRPDVVLIYKKETDVLIMTCARIGSHANVLNS